MYTTLSVLPWYRYRYRYRYSYESYVYMIIDSYFTRYIRIVKDIIHHTVIIFKELLVYCKDIHAISWHDRVLRLRHARLARPSHLSRMLGGLVDGRLVATVVIAAIIFAPLEPIKETLAAYDSTVFVGVLIGFVVISAIGTNVVLRSGELPANDELFDLIEHTPAQRAALRGEHVQRDDTR